MLFKKKELQSSPIQIMHWSRVIYIEEKRTFFQKLDLISFTNNRSQQYF